MNEPARPPHAVVNAIWRAWPQEAGEILASIYFSSLSGCYFFSRWGMLIGVETDGYIHT